MSKYNQTATYWAPSTLNEYAEQAFASPVPLSVRWEQKTETLIDKATGKEQKSQAVVYTTQDVLEEGFLYLGTSVATNPKTVAGAFPIKRFEKTPSVGGTNHIRKALLGVRSNG